VVALCSEALECFGGAGYIEDTGLPQLLRDAQVYAIWEGTTNVLALDSLRTLGEGLAALRTAIDGWVAGSHEPEAVAPIVAALDAAARQAQASGGERATLEASARGLAMTLARCAAAALLARQSTFARGRGDMRPGAALRRFVARGLDRLVRADTADTHLLL